MKFTPILLLCAALLACDTGRHDPLVDHCAYQRRGGSDVAYCRTTIVEVMADPHLFDGQMLTVAGWAVREVDEVHLYPFPEYASGTFGNTAILLIGGPGADKLGSELSPEISGRVPQLVTVSGRFKSLRRDASDTKPARLGMMDEVRANTLPGT